MVNSEEVGGFFFYTKLLLSCYMMNGIIKTPRTFKFGSDLLRAQQSRSGPLQGVMMALRRWCSLKEQHSHFAPTLLHPLIILLLPCHSFSTDCIIP